jgi:hypothetical protein
MRISPPRSQRLIRRSHRMNGAHIALEKATERDFDAVASSSKDGRRSSEVCPERRLAAAVFSQAADDLQKFRNARCAAGNSLYADARKWITSNDRLWPFSFLNLCEALHLAADVIRAELLGERSRRPFLNS